MANKMIDAITKFSNENKSEIILGIGIVTGLIGGVFAWKNAPKAKEIIEDKKKEAERTNKEYSKIDVVKDTWKCWVPPVGMAGLAIGCTIASNRIKNGEKAALATAYGMATTAFTEYQKKVVETIGEKKEGKIRDAIAEDHVRTMTPTTQVIYTGDGEYLCYDEISKTYFRSNQQKVMAAINELNHDMGFGNEPYKSVNDYLAGLHIPDLGVSGDKLGWSNSDLIDIRCTYASSESGEPCMVITPTPMPKIGFDNLYG